MNKEKALFVASKFQYSTVYHVDAYIFEMFISYHQL